MLGPVLFIVYINDIDLVIEDRQTCIFEYADDSKIGRAIQTQADAIALQTDIDRVWEWSRKWGMDIHPLKTCVMHFGYHNQKFDYYLNGTKISKVTSAKDLGVIISESCSPSDHVANIARKANSVLSQLRRTIISRNRDVVVNLFKVFVRPIIEAAGPAWSPYEKQFIDQIEKIQRRATRMIPGIGHLTYEDRLIQCRLPTLEQRRTRGDLIHVYKMLNGFLHINNENFFCFVNQRHNVTTRSSENNLMIAEKCRLDVRKYFFKNRIVQMWNNLPIEAREAASVNSFKMLYDEWNDNNVTT